MQLIERRLGLQRRLSTRFLISFSYLFRDMDDYREPIVAYWSRRRAPLRILCVGCATGEEAYSVAVVCRDMSVPVSVLGTDLSPAAVATARRGIYDLEQQKAWSRGPDTPDAAARIERFARYFDPVPGEARRRAVRDDIRRDVTFEVMDVCDLPYAGEFDFVICRKMLYYLPASARPHALRRMLAALKPGRGPEGVIFDRYTRSRPFFERLVAEAESPSNRSGIGAVE